MNEKKKKQLRRVAPKPSCRKCHGRGFIGLIEGSALDPYLCSCTVKMVEVDDLELKPKKIEGAKLGEENPKTDGDAKPNEQPTMESVKDM